MWSLQVCQKHSTVCHIPPWWKSLCYGFDENSTKYSKDYLSNRKQKKQPPYWHTVPAQVFSCEFCEISKSTFFTESLRRTASEDKNKQYVYQMNIKLHIGSTNRNLMPTNLYIFLYDVFLFMPNTDLVTYGNDNAPFAMGSLQLEEINEIKSATESLSLWLFKIIVWKWIQINFTFFLVTKKLSGKYLW